MSDPTKGDLVASMTLLTLLESVANYRLRQVDSANKFRLAAIGLSAGEITMTLEISGVVGALDGLFQLVITPRESTPETTRCDLSIGSGSGLSKLASLGAKLIPRSLINEALLHFFGEGLRIEGEQVMIDHAALMRTLNSRGRGEG